MPPDTPIPPTEAAALSNPPRAEAWAVTALVVVPSLIATAIERPLLTPDVALARVAGMVLWLGLGAAAVLLMIGWRRHHSAASAAALVLASHAQFEMTATWPGAVGLCMVLIAGAAAPIGVWRPHRRARGARGAGVAAGAALALCGAAAAWLAVVPALRWEAGLRAAAEAVRPAAEMATRAQEVFGREGPVDRMAASFLAQDLGKLLNIPAPTSAAEFDAAMNLLLARVSEPGVAGLSGALAASPSHFATAEALARLMLARAAAERGAGRAEGAVASAEGAVRVAEGFARAYPSAAAWGLAGNTHAGAAEITGDPTRLVQAAEAYEKGALLDRHGPILAVKAADTFAAAGKREEARRWAGEVLRRDELQRLDPLRRVTERERKRMEGLAGGS